MREKYLNFPLCLMKRVFNRQDIDEIVSYALIRYAMTLDYTEEAIARHTAYCYYRNPDELGSEYVDLLSELDDDFAFHDEDYFGFNSDGKFEAEAERAVLLKYFKQDEDFFKKCKRIYLIAAAAHTLGLKAKPAVMIIEDYEKLHKFVEAQEGQFGPDAWVSIRKDFVFDAGDGRISIHLFRLLVACKSLLTRKNFTKSYKSVIIPRMFGAKNNNGLTGEHSEEIDSISVRYRFDKLRNEAQQRGFLTFLPSLDRHGFYIMSGYNPEKLTQLIMERISKTEVKRRNQEAAKQLQEFNKRLKNGGKNE